MPSPFPGMDPYLEGSTYWTDFHDSLITYVRETLNPLLRPRYPAVSQHRLYVVEKRRTIWPDVTVLKGRRSRRKPRAAAVATLEPDPPMVVEWEREEVHERLLHTIDPGAGNRLVTALEVLSPENKSPGPGRESYLEKRRELAGGGANFVEIDLLRRGVPTVNVDAEVLERPPPWHYVVVVTRQTPPRSEIYATRLVQRLPRIGVPLAPKDADVVLDLQAVFARCWDAGPYADFLAYDQAPAGNWTKAERAWCRKRAKALVR